MNNQSNLADSLKHVLEDVAQTAVDSGRRAEDVKLIAVSKTLPSDIVRHAYDAGHRAFGENRVQELEAKASVLPGDCEWHMIGHLQRNKVKVALQYAALIHSIDSRRLLNRLEKIAAQRGQQVPILLQTNVAGEDSKYGVSPEDTRQLLEDTISSSHIDCRGLMTMAPYGAAATELHRIFGELRELRNQLADQFDTALPELSMGMSSDYKIAIMEGATMVRVGTAIFGSRH